MHRVGLKLPTRLGAGVRSYHDGCNVQTYCQQTGLTGSSPASRGWRSDIRSLAGKDRHNCLRVWADSTCRHQDLRPSHHLCPSSWNCDHRRKRYDRWRTLRIRTRLVGHAKSSHGEGAACSRPRAAGVSARFWAAVTQASRRYLGQRSAGDDMACLPFCLWNTLPFPPEDDILSLRQGPAMLHRKSTQGPIVPRSGQAHHGRRICWSARPPCTGFGGI